MVTNTVEQEHAASRKAGPADVPQPADDAAAKRGRAEALRPLLTLRPYLLKHRSALFLALVALIVSAVAMLSLPLAVRRVIDYGFSAGSGVFIDRYFAMLMLIGLILAVASAA